MSPQLGYCYLVPYETALKDKYGKTMWMLDENGNHILDNNGKWKKHTVKKAQFQMGYKGYIQLAQRTGKYEKIVALPIKEGELISRNEIEEEFNVCLIEDEFEREQAQTIGYYAMIKTTDNFRKAIYWPIRKMMAHADRYSPAFVSIEMEKAIPADREESEFDYTYADSDNQILQQSELDMVGNTNDFKTIDEMDNREQTEQEQSGSEMTEQEAIDIDSI